MSSVEIKQVIVVRTDLQMGKGKIAVQVAHASLSSAEIVKKHNSSLFKRWTLNGQAKVALKIESLEQLLDLQNSAKKKGIFCYLVQDKGLTQIDEGTTTCLAIGPANSLEIDEITSELKLL
tara:strand:- start:1365 stop:1727 length:363 start_codon:yes stop_codon:yes gene_type:complete